ncbi:hypothetical protein A9Q81_17510 [Gammaproteobacteria bacterium 42_54_T18]|nr:hypothetical protein A9Q81_17510 [Gammaproteobacteria bacterium 42_54_T18]
MQLDEANLTRNARVEILPLIDVVFLLLVFFIVMFLSMKVQRGLPLELPQVSETQTIQQESVQISINKTGDIAVDGKIVSLDKLIQEISRDKARSIIIQGDRKAELGVALQVLGQLTLAGFSNIAFAADEGVKSFEALNESSDVDH